MSDIAYTPRYGVEDYLQWEGDWELWDGHPVAMSPSPGVRHQVVAARLFQLLADALRRREGCRGCQALYELDWRVNEFTVLRPDLLVVCGDLPDDYLREAPALVGEILSPSTAEKDRTAKRALYEREGVRFYLMVDPDGNCHELLKLDDDGRYRSSSSLQLDIKLHDGCMISVDLSGILTD